MHLKIELLVTERLSQLTKTINYLSCNFMHTECITDVARTSRLRWFGHVEIKVEQ